MRSGAVLVEMALVLVIFTMLLFGIIEYCRFIFIRQVLVNAGREGARYAVAHTLDASVNADTQARVRAYMAGMDQKLAGFDVQLFQGDADGKKTGEATDAEFGEYVVVQIDCDYDPIVPVLLLMKDRIHLQSKTIMGSEAN
jgi:Flp pilus assembly protein TadG